MPKLSFRLIQKKRKKRKVAHYTPNKYENEFGRKTNLKKRTKAHEKRNSRGSLVLVNHRSRSHGKVRVWRPGGNKTNRPLWMQRNLGEIIIKNIYIKINSKE